MKTYRYDYIDGAKCLIDVPEMYNRRLGVLARFTERVREGFPSQLPDYVKTLSEALSHSPRPATLPESYATMLKEFPAWQMEPELLSSAAGFYLRTLNQPEAIEKAPQVEVFTADALRASLGLTYHQIKSLEVLMPKNDALRFWMDFLDRDIPNLALKKMGEVEEVIWAGRQPPGPFKNSFIATEFDLEDGRVGIRVKKCRWKEVLQEFADPEYAYAVACHYDFAAAKAANPNFVLTRTQTLTKDAPYCDFVWHDLRRDKACRHPAKSFWETL